MSQKEQNCQFLKFLEGKHSFPAPELSNLPTIRLFKLKLPTKTRKCHFRHFRDKTCVNHTFRLEKGNNSVKICLVYYFFAGFV